MVDTFLIVFVLTIVFSIFIGIYRADKSSQVSEKLKELITNYDDCTLFTSISDGEVARYLIDKENLLLYIYDYTKDQLIKTEICKITKCELILNSNLVQTTNTGSLLGRAIVGGALMGGVGAIAGGATASTVSKRDEKVKKGEIVIYYDDIDNPLQRLIFIKNNSNVIEDISHFHATLCACMSKTKVNEVPIIRQCPFCAEDIKTLAKICKHCGNDVSAEK